MDDDKDMIDLYGEDYENYTINLLKSRIENDEQSIKDNPKLEPLLDGRLSKYKKMLELEINKEKK